MRFWSFIYDCFSFNSALELTRHCILVIDLESESLIYYLNWNLGYLNSVSSPPPTPGMSLCVCPLASLFFLFSLFLWVFNSSLGGLLIIYDILLLVRCSWKTCFYGNCCFQTGWFQLQNNIIKYATAHISFNGKCVLMICTTKSENLNT